MSIEPEVSTTIVRATGGQSSASTSRAWRPIRTSRVPSVLWGAIAWSARSSRSSRVGEGKPLSKELTHSSTRTDSRGGRMPSASRARATRYEPVSTSAANVDRGFSRASTKPLVPASTNVLSSSGPGWVGVGGRGVEPDDPGCAGPPWAVAVLPAAESLPCCCE